MLFRNLFVIFLVLTYLKLFSQQKEVLSYVNPFIGTTKTTVASQWGVDGGTYPGAVAPFGFVQLSPETRVTDTKGYNYTDKSIFYFSCINHASGYPEGSAGNIFVMPVEADRKFEAGKYSRQFSHQDEKAIPGFYSVLFRDNGTVAAMSASEHTGMFRFVFPAGVSPKVFIGDIGTIVAKSNHEIEGSKYLVKMVLNSDFTEKEEVTGGSILTFPSISNRETVIVLKFSTSQISFESSMTNLQVEAETWDFYQFKSKNQKKWVEALSVIEVEDSSKENKTIFYTALYHSQLLPWIISDAKGQYKGADGSTLQTKGQNQYGHFSPWDTFRSLHPLLTLIAPDRQNDMISTLLDSYTQTGKLPKGPMTGNHTVPIIVDAYLKGICNYDSALAYKAMISTLYETNNSKDFKSYITMGYVPSTFSESVTQTVEYAYDDWALAQFSLKVMGAANEYKQLIKRSHNYRNLFNYKELYILPRNGETWETEPANFGYKEGDKWSYSMFVLHNNRDLINLMGGDDEFTNHLDSGLVNQIIPFDNEPILHVPYLFNSASHPEKTQYWVRNFMRTHYKSTADGLPGNDDLGSMSSWYVFSAMGFFPVCPGSPIYDLGSPIFKKLTLKLKGGKKFVITTENKSEKNVFVKSLSFNGLEYNKLFIDHSSLANGGVLSFKMTNEPKVSLMADLENTPPSETLKVPEFKLSNIYSSEKQVIPDQPFSVHFTLKNQGSSGTKIVRLFVDGKEAHKKAVFVEEYGTINDSIDCQLYEYGQHSVKIDDSAPQTINVKQTEKNLLRKFEISELNCGTIFEKGKQIDLNCMVQNKNGFQQNDTLLIFVDEKVIQNKVLTLNPGEKQKLNFPVVLNEKGLHLIIIGKLSKMIKIYSDPIDSKVIDLNLKATEKNGTFPDLSGLKNHGFIKTNGSGAALTGYQKTDENNYIEFDHSESIDHLGETITLMAWVFPVQNGRSRLADIITKGDFINFQTDGKNLSFFAGGWGRGSVSIPLPKNWFNNWHHIAGISDGVNLKIYIDGIESGNQVINAPVNLSTTAKLMIGRNEEFPEQRFFHGNIGPFKLFVEPLTASQVKIEMEKNRPVPVQ